MSTVTIYHNPRCSKSRKTLALLNEHNVQPDIVLYLESPPSEAELKAILAKLGITPAHVWSEHVETGECQLKQNQRYQKEMAGGRAAICQSKGCKTKLTDIKYFKCPQCAMDLCMAHRFDDLHDCKPVKKS